MQHVVYVPTWTATDCSLQANFGAANVHTRGVFKISASALGPGSWPAHASSAGCAFPACLGSKLAILALPGWLGRAISHAAPRRSADAGGGGSGGSSDGGGGGGTGHDGDDGISPE